MSVAADGTPDVLGPGVRLLFVGINPGLVSAAAGHNFANPRNCFWRALHRAGFTDRELRPDEERELLRHGLGLTNAARRVTRGSGGLRAADFAGAHGRLTALVNKLGVTWVAFVGKDAYAPLCRPRRPIKHGLQPEQLGTARVYVLPSTSPANAALGLRAKIAWFSRLWRLSRDVLPADGVMTICDVLAGETPHGIGRSRKPARRHPAGRSHRRADGAEGRSREGRRRAQGPHAAACRGV